MVSPYELHLQGSNVRTGDVRVALLLPSETVHTARIEFVVVLIVIGD